MNVCGAVIEKLGFDKIKLVHGPCEQQLDPFDYDDAGCTAATDNVRHVYAEILGFKYNREDDDAPATRTTLGSITGYLYRFAEAYEDREAITTDTADFDGDAHSSAALLEGLSNDYDFRGDCLGYSGLYIHSVHFEPQYRGHGLAGMALRRVIEWQSDLFAVAVYPMTTLCDTSLKEPRSQAYEGGLIIHRYLDRDERATILASPEQKKLESWCRKLGFRKRPGWPGYMVLNMDSYQRTRWVWKERKKKTA